MADALASTSDIVDAWRLLVGDEIHVARSKLTFASAIVRAEIRDVDDRITAGTLDPNLVTGVVVEMVLRVMRNPDGKVEEQIEDYRYRLDSAQSTGGMYLSDVERALLGPRAGRAFSIAPQIDAPTYANVQRIGVFRDERLEPLDVYADPDRWVAP